MIPVLFALLVQTQQPGRPPVAQAQIQPSSSQPRTPFDSTVAAIRRIGLAVAEVKSQVQLFGRVAVGEPDTVVMERAVMLQDRCRALARSAAEDGRALCRSCVTGERREALDRYRAYLASLGRVGSQCATLIARQRRGGTLAARAAGLKREARTIMQGIVAGFGPYEQRVLVLRQAFGWAPPPARTRPRS
jgi:hypothetical protein